MKMTAIYRVKTQGYTQVLLGLTIGNEAIMIHVHYSDFLRSLSIYDCFIGLT